MTTKEFTGEAGRLWDWAQAEFELDRVAGALLRQACRTLVEIGEMEEALGAEGYLVQASHGPGTTKVNPLVAAVRQHRAAFSRLMRELDLEPEETTPPSSGRRRSPARQWAER